MSRILFVTAFVPSKIAAGENYSRQLINDISHDNIVDLIFFKYPYDQDYIVESGNVTVLKVFRNSTLIKLINFLMLPVLFPLFTARFNIFRLAYLRRIVKRGHYDKIVFDFSQTFLFARFIKNVPVILNSHDVIAQRYSRIFRGLLVPFARISERYVLNHKNATIFCHSYKDKSLLQRYYSISAIASDVYVDKVVLDTRHNNVEDYFVLFANWKRPDNSNGLKWFLKNVYPELKIQSEFRIIGPGLSPEISKGIPDLKNVTYEGFIENPYPVIANSKALISPLFSGAGVKVKVIESLACGTPVIGTQLSFEGIDERFRRFNIIAETPLDFITAILSFEFDKERKTELKDTFLESYQKRTLAYFIKVK